MAIALDAKRRWQKGMVGNVAIWSPKGIASVTLLVLTGSLVFLPALWSLGEWMLTGSAPASPEIDRDLLVLNLAFSTFVLLIVPIVVIGLSRPGEPGAVARRLRLYVTPMTPVYAIIGAAITVACLLGLGTIVALLDHFGLYEAEESDLLPQLQALLTPTIVLAVPMVAAVTEEVYFRGLLQPRIGILASSVLFAVIHAGYATVIQLVAPFFLGLIFAVLYEHTKSLWAPIAAHFVFDLIQFSVLYFVGPS